jgi:hypothetical protein
MSIFIIRPIGFPADDHPGLEAILTLGRNRLRDEWRWSTEGAADVYLVAVESPEQWEKCRAAFPAAPLVACVPVNLEVGLAEARAIDFHNACTALDLLERGGASAIRDKPVDEDLRELFHKIVRRLDTEE